jgi:hypothetical protein
MKAYKSIVILTVANLVFIPLNSCNNSSTCKLQSIEPDKPISVQSTDNFYENVFNDENGCLPQKIILRVPNNLKAKDGKPINSNDKSNSPKISTIITISNEPKRFFLRRIDHDGSKWFYTRDSTCLAWRLSVEDKKQVFSLSTERNLQIDSSGIKKIIFIISIPFESVEKNPELLIESFTWTTAGNTFKLTNKNFPKLKKILRLSETGDIQAGKTFYAGEAVEPAISQELDRIDMAGGVQYESDFAPILKPLKSQRYEPGPASPSCVIPQSFIKSK